MEIWRVPEVLASLGVPEATPVSVRLLTAGAYHRHAILAAPDGAWLLRACVDSEWGEPPAVALRRERETLLALEPTGVAPRPIALVGDDDRPVLVEELVAGRHFDYARDLPALGEALAQVHALAPAHVPCTCPRELLPADGRAWLDAAEAAGEDAAAVALVRRLEPAAFAEARERAPHVLVHTDLNAANLLVDSGARILDWEAARLGPAEWDLAHALSPTTTHWDGATACTLDPDDCAAFLDAYVAASADPAAARAAVDRIPAMLAAVSFRALAWALGFAAVARREGRLLDARITDALERYRRPEFVEHCLDVVRAPVAA
jgi:aminoglycoside phosphotransferase (APT) family kinase protein